MVGVVAGRTERIVALSAAERQAKLRLAYALNQVLEARKLSQADAAKVVTQPRVSALRHYKLAHFLRRTPGEPVDGARPRHRDRDSVKAPLAKGCSDQRRRDLSDVGDDGLRRP
jgi:hypothetical protein